jgi:hypothetical protein
VRCPTTDGHLECDPDRRIHPRESGNQGRRRLNSLDVIDTLADAMLRRGVLAHIRSDNGLSKKAMARNEHTTAVARRASNAGYDCAIVEKTMHRPGSLRGGAPSRVRSHSSPADAALDRRRHCG